MNTCPIAPSWALCPRMPYGDVARTSATTETPQPSTTYKPEGQNEPLWWRILSQEHMVALVRMFGHRELSIEEARTQMKELVERYGKEIMVAAAEEIVEQDGRGKVQIARLTERARNLAVQLIGRAPQAECSASTATPPSTEPTLDAQQPSTSSSPQTTATLDRVTFPSATRESGSNERSSVHEQQPGSIPSHRKQDRTYSGQSSPNRTPEGRTARLSRTGVLKHFEEYLKSQGEHVIVVDDAMRRQLTSERIFTLDFILQGGTTTRLITVRKKLTALQRHDMLRWRAILVPDATPYVVWPLAWSGNGAVGWGWQEIRPEPMR